MKTNQKLMSVIAAGVLLAGPQLLAAEKSAAAIMKNAYAYAASLDNYAFKAVVSSQGEEDENFKQNIAVKIDRPGKLRMDTKGTRRNSSFYLNEGMFTMMDHNLNYYGTFKAKETIDASLDLAFDKYGITAPLASLMYSDMGTRINPKNSKYFGTRDLGGTECDYVAFNSGIGEIHVWIATGDKPLVKHYSVIDNSGDQAYRKDTSIKWDTDPKTKSSDFVFKAPKGASEISVKSAR